MGKIPAAASSQKLREKKNESSKRLRVNIASVCQNIGRGTLNHEPLLHGKKNSTRVWGENYRITFPPNQGFHDARGNNPLFILGEHTLALCKFSGLSQKSHTILEKILTSNRQKKGSECTICIIFSKILSGRPRPLTPYCKRIKKTPLLDFILFSTANLKILPHHVYRRLEISRQNNTQFLGRNQHELCKKIGHRIHHLLPIFKKISGKPRFPDPTARR